MRHRLFNIITLLSLLLCIVTVILYVRSFQAADGIYFGTAEGRFWEFRTSREQIAYVVTYWNWPVDTPLTWKRDSYHVGPSGVGFGAYYDWEPHYPWNHTWSGWLVERADVRLFVSDDNRTPLFGAPTHQSNTADSSPMTPMWVMFCPLLFVIGATGILPATRIITYGRRRLILSRRRKKGLCLKCGYDIRASNDKCPECGTPVLGNSSANPASNSTRSNTI
jgi:hypothetical protein